MQTKPSEPIGSVKYDEVLEAWLKVVPCSTCEGLPEGASLVVHCPFCEDTRVEYIVVSWNKDWREDGEDSTSA